MNYSRSYVRNYNSPEVRKSHAARRKFFHTVVKTILILVVVIIVALIIGFTFYAKKQVETLPPVSSVRISPTGLKSRIVSADGSTLRTMNLNSTSRRPVKLSQIPLVTQRAFIAIEDERFYKHNGVDLRSMVRETFAGISGGQGRATTITQQLMENVYFSSMPKEKSFSGRLSERIREQYMAIRLEKIKSKSEILEGYLNTVELGEYTIGVAAASERYFNKSVSELSLSESAVLAAIAGNPSKYDPIDHERANARRRESVLKKMLDDGYISMQSYREAMDDDVYERISTKSPNTDGTTSYFEDALVAQVTRDLMRELGLSETEAYMKLYTGGLTIHATEDSTLQRIVDKEVSREKNYGRVKYSLDFELTVEKGGRLKTYDEQSMLEYYKKDALIFDSKDEAEAAYKDYRKVVTKGGEVPADGENVRYILEPEAAVVVIDQETGQVKAIAGGRGKANGGFTNRACDATYQPGAAFQVLAAYAPAIDAGGMTLASVEDDAEYFLQTGEEVSEPDGHYRGFTTLREGIEDSADVVAAKALTDIGPGLGYQYVRDFGISTLKEGDNNQALALGGLSRGVKVSELTAAYASIADGGYYRRPSFYSTVEDHEGKVILNTSDDKVRRVLKKSTAWLLTSAMLDKSGMAAQKSSLFCAGYSPYYTCAVWSGYEDGTGDGASARIFRRIMSQAQEGLAAKSFVRPQGIVTARVCRKSGKLPVDGVCDHDPRGNMVYKEFFTSDSVPEETCDHHIRLSICKASGLPAGDACPQKDIVSKVFITGGSKGTDDEKYLISTEDIGRICDVHKGR